MGSECGFPPSATSFDEAKPFYPFTPFTMDAHTDCTTKILRTFHDEGMTVDVRDNVFIDPEDRDEPLHGCVLTISITDYDGKRAEVVTLCACHGRHLAELLCRAVEFVARYMEA